MSIATFLPFIVTNGIRLSMASSRAYEQHVRDRESIFPDAAMATWTQRDAVLSDFTGLHASLVGPEGRLAHLWSGTGPRNDDAYDELEIEWIKLRFTDKGVNEARAEMLSASVKLRQWEAGQGPIHPFAQIGLTLVDIGLEFIAAHPTTVGVDGAGGQLIAGVALRLTNIIPEDAKDFHIKADFANRLLALVLRSGLKSLSENAPAVIGETHLQELVVAGLAPVIDALPDDINDQAQWRQVTQAFAGPAFRAALGVIARQPAAFHGTLNTGTAAGAVVQAVLLEAAKANLGTVFTPSGVEAFVRSAVGVVADHPELFANGTSAKAPFHQDLFSRLATSVRDAPWPLTGDVAASVAAAALDALKHHAPLLHDAGDDWDDAVMATTDMVIEGLKAGLIARDAGQLGKIFTAEKLTELARVVLLQVAANPRIIIGQASGGSAGTKRNRELQNVVAAVATAMAADAKLLLTSDDWIEIARVALEEVSDNPGHLVGLDDEAAGSGALSGLLTTVIATVGKSVGVAERNTGHLAFGRTLREVLIASIRVLSTEMSTLGNPAKRAQIEDLIEWLIAYTRANPDEIGGKQWLKLYTALVPTVLAGEFKIPTPASVEVILKA